MFTTFEKLPASLAEAEVRYASLAEVVEKAAVQNEAARGIARSAWKAFVGSATQTERETDAVVLAINTTMTTANRIAVRSTPVASTFATQYFLAYVLEGGTDVEDDFALRVAAKKAWAEFDQRRRTADSIEEGFGCDASKSWHTLRQTADHPDVQKKIAAIANLAGRMFDSMHYTRRKVEDDSPQQVSGATIGGDVQRLLPADLALLGDDATKLYATKKIVEKQARQFRMKGERSVQRGPLVLAIDESGSMHDEAIGYRGRNTWAKAVAVALTRVAWSEGRQVRAVHFGDHAVTQRLPKNDTRAMFELASSFLSGGTKIVAALRRALDEVGDLEAEGHKGADVVLVTDGQDHDVQAISCMLDKYARQGVRLWTVSIGQDIAEAHPVRSKAERYVYAHDRILHTQDGSAIAELLKDAAMDGGKADA